jgi:hypothetical protein
MGDQLHPDSHNESPETQTPSSGDGRWEQVFGASGTYKQPQRLISRKSWANVVLAIACFWLVTGAVVFVHTRGGISVALILGAVLLLVGAWMRDRAPVKPHTAPPPSLPPPPA